MPDGITMRLDNQELTGYLEKMEGRLNAKKDFFTVVVSMLHNTIIANFRRGGRPKRWEPLSAWTLQAREERAKQGIGRGHRNIGGLDQPILQDTGKLLQSIGSVNQIASNFCEYGTRDKRAPKLQGTGFGRAHGTRVNLGTRTVTIPGRPFILFQDSDVKDISAYAATFALAPEEKLPIPPKII